MTLCKTCTTGFTSNYCPDCGAPRELKRIDGHYLVHEIEHVLHFERGILFTVRALLTRPGESVKRYLTENRRRLVKPIIFIIVASLIYSLCSHFFHFKDGYMNFTDDKKSTTASLFGWVQGHYGYANIIMGVFIALWTKLFFRKRSFNIFEILILLCFVMGMGMLILSVFGIVEGLTQVPVLQFGAILVFVYTSWAVGQFYDKKKVRSYVKAFFAYLLGMISFVLILLVTGGIVDTLIKH